MKFKVQMYDAQVRKDLKAAKRKALFKAAEKILEESNRIVPLDEGTLQRSGEVDIDVVGGEATISYDTPYAARQHEDVTLNHPNGREAKYLEKAMRANEGMHQKLYADELKKLFKE